MCTRRIVGVTAGIKAGFLARRGRQRYLRPTALFINVPFRVFSRGEEWRNSSSREHGLPTETRNGLAELSDQEIDEFIPHGDGWLRQSRTKFEKNGVKLSAKRRCRRERRSLPLQLLTSSPRHLLKLEIVLILKVHRPKNNVRPSESAVAHEVVPSKGLKWLNHKATNLVQAF